MSCAHHLQNILEKESVKHTTNKLIKMIENTKVEFTHIVCTGISGIVPSSIVANILDKGLVVVRSHESSHSTNKVECYGNGIDKFIIIDDLVDTGATIQRICDTLYREMGINHDRCVGVYLYSDDCVQQVQDIITSDPETKSFPIDRAIQCI